MSLSFVVAALIILVVVLALAAYSTAQRLDRLHIRTDSARQALQGALDRRAAVLAALRPEATEQARAAEAIALTYGRFDARAAAEREVRAKIQALGPEPPAQIVDANVRVELAHRFYNEAVADTRALRLVPLVRWLRLGGTAPLPQFFEFTPS